MKLLMLKVRTGIAIFIFLISVLVSCKKSRLQTFGELEVMLPKDKLFRVHKSYMVSIDKIEFIERNRIKIRDKLIPLSETYKVSFYALMGLKDAPGAGKT